MAASGRMLPGDNSCRTASFLFTSDAQRTTARTRGRGVSIETLSSVPKQMMRIY